MTAKHEVQSEKLMEFRKQVADAKTEKQSYLRSKRVLLRGNHLQGKAWCQFRG
jgi:hypothetical protein